MDSLPGISTVRETPSFKMEDISLSVDNVEILKHIHLDLYPRETHAIVGDRGSGKTSIGLIFAGLGKPSSGKLFYGKQECSSLTQKKSRRLKIEMVYEDIHLLDYFTVAENLLIPDRVMYPFPLLDRKRMFAEAERILGNFGFAIEVTAILKNLSLSEKTVIYIVRSLLHKPELLILDEALEKLSAQDFEKILAVLAEMKEKGLAVLCITHRIDDIYSFADRVSILKNGEIILTDSVDNIDRINLIKLCYTQFSRNDYIENINQEFYQLLRYNEAILRKLPVNLIVTDTEHRIKMINDYGKNYFNKTDTSSYVNLLLDTVLKEENRELIGLIKQALAEKRERVFYQVPMNLDGTKRFADIKTFPIFDGSFIIGQIIILEDITEQEHLRRHVILSEKLASVGLLAAGVAHEINNPLAIIENYLIALEMSQDRDQAAVLVGNLKDEMASIKQIVSNLISFSDSNKIISESFDVNELISGMITLTRHNARHKKIRIKFEPVTDNLNIVANKNEIKQVLLNFFKNSFEAMPQGGEIYITTAGHFEDGLERIRITIKDTGFGIDDANTKNIFLPFYSTKKGKSDNLGLGLSVSYGIIKKYNGSITVSSEKGKGCEFTISLPQKPVISESRYHEANGNITS